ncbi:hypothetical protein [Demequina sediminicola]|uniref:hypothetical protein n=1 Tax=Demequina sediminicola TaxID=1095026 RepID=UPI00128B8332|nr:hypothetical protein [Demequina sediminicola]
MSKRQARSLEAAQYRDASTRLRAFFCLPLGEIDDGLVTVNTQYDCLTPRNPLDQQALLVNQPSLVVLATGYYKN